MAGPKMIKKEYTHLEVEAALCVWECLNEWTLNDGRPDWIELREGVGSVEMRHQSIALGKWCLKIYDICTAHDPDFFDGIAYDWEVIPMMLDYAYSDDHRLPAPVIYEEGFPDPFKTAQLVIHRHLFNEFERDCRHQANEQWCYGDLIKDHPERVYQSFTLGEEPKEFVQWLGEKYDLSSKGPWG